MARPRVLLLDEPSLGLAPAIIDELFDTLAELRDEGITILLVDQMAALALHGRRPRLRAGIGPHRARRHGRGAAPGPRAGSRLSRRPRSGGVELMAFDLVLREARTATDAGSAGRHRHRRTAASPRSRRAACRTPAQIEPIGGALVVPGFVETHIHLDKSLHHRPLQHRRRHASGSHRRDGARQARPSPRRTSSRARAAHAGEAHPQRHHAHAHPCRGRSAHRPERLPRRAHWLARDYRLGASTWRSACSRRRGCSTTRAPRSCWSRPAARAPT